MDPLGAERVDRDGGHQRRVDATREADHGLGEAVLAEIVAGAEHQGGVHLGVVAGSGRGAARDSGARWLRRGSVTANTRQQPGHRHAAGAEPIGRSTTTRSSANWAPEPSSVPSAATMRESPSKTSSSWPPTWFDIGDGAAGLGHPAREHGQPLVATPPVVGRRVEVDHDVGAGTPGVAPPGRHRTRRPRRSRRRPRRRPRRRASAARCWARTSAARRTRRSWAGNACGTRRRTRPPAQTAAALARLPPSGAAPTNPTTKAQWPRGGGDLLECGDVVGHEPRLEQQVLGRVPGDGQLGRDADVGPGRLGRRAARRARAPRCPPSRPRRC